MQEAIQQVARKVRGPGGGGGGKTGKGATGTPAKGGTVHAVHAEVHAETEGREPVAGSMKARAATVKLAQRVEWLPVLEQARTFVNAPDLDERWQLGLYREFFPDGPRAAIQP